VEWFGIEPMTTLQKAGDQLPEPWHGQRNSFVSKNLLGFNTSNQKQNEYYKRKTNSFNFPEKFRIQH
jgi:hypothetical protein